MTLEDDAAAEWCDRGKDITLDDFIFWRRIKMDARWEKSAVDGGSVPRHACGAWTRARPSVKLT